MHSSFIGLGIGLVMAIVLIYLLLVVNFQSWLDPFIIITALPGALAGVVWALYLTLTTVSVPALMGAIMSLGVATANSVLVVTFARNDLQQGMDPLAAAWEAGVSRLRPVLMTAVAMMIGMLPMALGLGEGGEQNAPLGRAVIGGLVVATIATLFFVPVVFSLLHRRATAPVKTPSDFAPSSWRHQALPPPAPELNYESLCRTTHPTPIPPARAARGVNRRKPPRAPAPSCATPRSWPPCSSSLVRWPAWFPAGCIARRCAPRRGNWPFKPSAWSRPSRAKPPPG